jgi:hypothetical protein
MQLGTSLLQGSHFGSRHNLKNSNCQFCVCPSFVSYAKPYGDPCATNLLLPW